MWAVARALHRCAFLPLLDISSPEPSKLEGCWFAPQRSVGARCEVVEFSQYSLSVLGIFVALANSMIYM